jgi:hypothetical protein
VRSSYKSPLLHEFWVAHCRSDQHPRQSLTGPNAFYLVVSESGNDNLSQVMAEEKGISELKTTLAHETAREAASRGQVATDQYGRPLVEFDAAAESRLRLKIDLYIVPTVSLLYLFCFIDRANIGMLFLHLFSYTVWLTILSQVTPSLPGLRKTSA